MRAIAILIAAQCLVVVGAQAGPVAPGLSGKEATQVFLVQPDGKLTRAPDSLELKLQSEVLTQPASVGDVLRKKGLHEDAQTIDMLKKLNPHQDFSLEKLPAGSKIDLFAPKEPAVIDADWRETPITFDNALVGKLAAKEYLVKTENVRLVAYSLPNDAFEHATDIQTHRKAVIDIERAAKALVDKADALSAQDYAFVQYQIDYASRSAAHINNKATGPTTVGSKEIQAVEKIVAATNRTIETITHNQALPMRHVKVNVYQGESNTDVPHLQVYILPSGFFDKPYLYDDGEILAALTHFSFLNEASPAEQNLVLFDARVWVGDKGKYTEMAQLVKQQQLKKFTPINDPLMTLKDVELVFRAPQDLVQP